MNSLKIYDRIQRYTMSKQVVTVRLPEGYRQFLEEEATALGGSISDAVKDAIATQRALRLAAKGVLSNA